MYIVRGYIPLLSVRGLWNHDNLARSLVRFFVNFFVACFTIVYRQ